MNETSIISSRFRGLYPIIIDIETAGFNCKTDAILEIAAVSLGVDDENKLKIEDSLMLNVAPFEGANLCEQSLKFTGIKPFCAFREAISEKDALLAIRTFVKKYKRLHKCEKAIIVGHNVNFDFSFLKECAIRNNMKLNFFHSFSSLDTVTMSALMLKETVLIKACRAWEIEFDGKKAHNALYDALKTAELFCHFTNKFDKMNSES